MKKVLEIQAAHPDLSVIPKAVPSTEERGVGEGFGIRAVAYIIDLFAIFALQLAGSAAGVFLLGVVVAATDQRMVFKWPKGPAFFVIGMIFSMLYFTILEAWFGASVGKSILRLRVVKTDGEPCDFKSALIRSLYRLIDGLFFGAPAAANMKRPLQQRLGDKAAKTVVVSSRATFIQNPRPWWRLLLAGVLYLFLVAGTMGVLLFIVGTGAAQGLPDLSEVVLTSQDFPQGFLELSVDQFGLEVGQPDEEGLVIESGFALLSTEPFEMIYGFTYLLPNKSEQVSFDRDMQLADVFAGMGAEGASILEQPQLLDVKVVGDASKGFTIVMDEEGVAVRLDMVLFRRDVVGAIVCVMYEDSEVPVVTVDDATRKLYDYIIEALSAND
jgi:uncharacterized RDD family membrane protein YckC